MIRLLIVLVVVAALAIMGTTATWAAYTERGIVSWRWAYCPLPTELTTPPKEPTTEPTTPPQEPTTEPTAEPGPSPSGVPQPPVITPSPKLKRHGDPQSAAQKVVFHGSGLYELYGEGSVEGTVLRIINGEEVNEKREVLFTVPSQEQFLPMGTTHIFKFDAQGHHYWGKVVVYRPGADIELWLEGNPPTTSHQGAHYRVEVAENLGQ